MFIPANKVDASDIRRLPKRWWEKEEAADLGIPDIISNMFCSLLEDIRQCDDADDDFSSSDMTWMTGNPDARTYWESPAKDTSSANDSDDASCVYNHEFRIISLVEEDSVPFDEKVLAA